MLLMLLYRKRDKLTNQIGGTPILHLQTIRDSGRYGPLKEPVRGAALRVVPVLRLLQAPRQVVPQVVPQAALAQVVALNTSQVPAIALAKWFKMEEAVTPVMLRAGVLRVLPGRMRLAQALIGPMLGQRAVAVEAPVPHPVVALAVHLRVAAPVVHLQVAAPVAAVQVVHHLERRLGSKNVQSTYLK